MKKLNDFTLIAISVAAVVFGILFCLNNIIGATLDIIFGICFILLGLALSGLSLYNKRGVLTVLGISGGAIVAFGVAMIVYRMLAGWFIYGFVPFAFIVLGVFLICEAILLFFVRGEKKTSLFVVELVVGTVLLALGILAIAIVKVQGVFNIIEGVILILAGLFVLVSKLVIKKDEE